jgi:hypothetical protein
MCINARRAFISSIVIFRGFQKQLSCWLHRPVFIIKSIHGDATSISLLPLRSVRSFKCVYTVYQHGRVYLAH